MRYKNKITKINSKKRKINNKMKNKSITKTLTFSITLILISIFSLSFASAGCNDFVTYYGSCEGAGDIIVEDVDGNVIVEQLYTIDKGCYENKYLVSVPGGSSGCPVSDGDSLRFKVSGKEYTSHLFDVNQKYVELNLERPKYKQGGNVLSSGSVYLLLSVLAILVVFYFIIRFYRRRVLY